MVGTGLLFYRSRATRVAANFRRRECGFRRGPFNGAVWGGGTSMVGSVLFDGRIPSSVPWLNRALQGENSQVNVLTQE